MTGNPQGMNKPDSRNVKNVFVIGLPLLFLAVPSLWLMAVVPPLWRDVDAYVQVVFPPNVSTILLHGPLYCTLSRVPLWFGYLISGAGPAVRLGHFIKHTQLTDRGVFVLLLLQHAALWCAALYFINAVAATLSARLILAVFFGSHPVFYTFAHCIGSETLSMIITVLLAGAGLRIVLCYPDVIVRDWILFGALLCSGILTRHLNYVLAALLPVTILLIAICESLRILLGRRRAKSIPNLEFGKSARLWAVSVATGLSAIILATSFTHLLCWHAHIHWRPKFGYTFVWRLDFLNRVPVASRGGFFKVAASRCHVPETRQLLTMLANWFGQTKPWDPPQFVKEAQTALFSSPGNWDWKFQEEKFDRSLNEMAYAFLCPPSAALCSAALNDFKYATQLREADIVHSLFVTTDFIFDHRTGMPQCAQLRTFREPRTGLTETANRSYFRWWNPLSLCAWSIIGVLVLSVAVFMNVEFGTGGGKVILYSATLSTFGIIMVALNCFFAGIQPRFVLTMTEFLFLSMMILLGLISRGWHQKSEKFQGDTDNQKT